MKKTTKIINEGFMRKYMKEDLQDKLKSEIKHTLQHYGYNTSVDGTDNYISAVAEYIDIARDYADGYYTIEDWLHDTELNYPEELEFMKSMNESTELNLGPLSFKSDLGTKVIDNADKISKTVSTLSPLLADDASEKEEIKSKEVFHNDNGQDYDVIERSSSGKNALLKRGNKWIVAWNCPKDSGSWGQGHYFFDEESARKVWEDKYLNESFKRTRKLSEEFSEKIWDKLPSSIKTSLNNAWNSNKSNKWFDVYLTALVDANILDEKDKKEILQSNIEDGFEEEVENGSLKEKLEYSREDGWAEINDILYDVFDNTEELIHEVRNCVRDSSANTVTDLVHDLRSISREFEDAASQLEDQSKELQESNNGNFLKENLNKSLKIGKLRSLVKRLNEIEMSDEDKADSALLRSIYNKTQQRANAKLTPEETAVLDKYNLRRDSGTKNIRKNTSENPWGDALISGRVRDKFDRWNQDETKINLADRARKMDSRGTGYHATQGYYYDSASDDHREWKDPETGRWQRLKDKGLLDQERKHQDSVMQEPVRQMKDAIKDRKYHGKNVDDNNAKYDAARDKIQREYEKKLADNEKSRKWSGEYHQNELDRANQRINKLLKRDTDK